MATALSQAWAEYIARHHWQLWTTPTFRHAVTREYAERAVSRWLSSMGSQVYAYVAYESGWAGGRLHCHALVGGIYRGRSVDPTGLDLGAMAVAAATEGWSHGDIEVVRYDPRQGAANYAAKCPNDGEIVGRPRRHTRHKRRTRRSRVR